MPLVFIRDIDERTRLGLWAIDDSLRMEDVCPKGLHEHVGRTCTKRQKETTAIYALLGRMTGRKDIIVEHDHNGKPFIHNGPHIGISHTMGFATIILSEDKEVAVDIEYTNERVYKIIDKFLTTKEKQEFRTYSQEKGCDVAVHGLSRNRLLLYWCAKETAYKYFSAEKLSFEEMAAELTNAIEEEGVFNITNKKSNSTKEIRYMQNEHFVLTYTL